MPLQLICASAELIGMSLEDPTLDARLYLDMLNASARQMRRMLDGAMSDCRRELRIEAPRPRDLDVVSCLRGLCLRCQAYAGAQGVTLACAGNVERLVAETDEDLLSRVVLNLISNALKAVPRGGRVDVTWTALGDYLEITVRDDGAGIPEERLPWIFLWGETGGGHGFGLPGARDCARRLGGDLTATSEPGRGSAFTLRLPVRTSMVS
jgi:signal transduction histidine kinase